MFLLLTGVLGKDAQVSGAEQTVISKSGGKTLCHRQVQRFVSFEIITDNNELNNDSIMSMIVGGQMKRR